MTLDAPESRLGAFKVGRRATVTFATLPDQHFDAQVREIAPAADPQSRTYRVKLSLIPPGRDLRLGMTGEAVLAVLTATAGASEQHHLCCRQLRSFTRAHGPPSGS